MESRIEHGKRLLADCAEPCNSGATRGGRSNDPMRIAAATCCRAQRAVAAMTVPLDRGYGRRPRRSCRRSRLPPPISSAERLQRLAKARDLMRRNGIGAVIVESGPSLDYFTGIQWWRSERLTGVVIPARRRTDRRHALLRAARASRRCSRSRRKSAPGRRMRSR